MIFKGQRAVRDIYKGSRKVEKVFHGNDLVYSTGENSLVLYIHGDSTEERTGNFEYGDGGLTVSGGYIYCPFQTCFGEWAVKESVQYQSVAFSELELGIIVMLKNDKIERIVFEHPIAENCMHLVTEKDGTFTSYFYNMEIPDDLYRLGSYNFGMNEYLLFKCRLDANKRFRVMIDGDEYVNVQEFGIWDFNREYDLKLRIGYKPNTLANFEAATNICIDYIRARMTEVFD